MDWSEAERRAALWPRDQAESEGKRPSVQTLAERDKERAIMDIILASQSPRRKELLKQMGLAYRVVVAEIDEHMERDLPPDKLVEAISAEKAAAVAAGEGPESVIIAADTVVALDGEVLGKPHSEAQAAEMLGKLSGREHQVYTGFTVRQGERIVTDHQRSEVRFRSLSDQEITAYIATGEPMDKAGAYGIQGLGSLLVEGIHGDYFNVMGLPVCMLGQTLKEFGIDRLT